GPAAAWRSTGTRTSKRVAAFRTALASVIDRAFDPCELREAVRSLLFLFLAALEKLDRRGRHDRGDGVLIDELGVCIPAQQHREIVEPGDDALQLHPADEIDRHRRLVLADVVEKDILDVLGFRGGHGSLLCWPFCGTPYRMRVAARGLPITELARAKPRYFLALRRALRSRQNAAPACSPEIHRPPVDHGAAGPAGNRHSRRTRYRYRHRRRTRHQAREQSRCRRVQVPPARPPACLYAHPRHQRVW